MRQGIAVGGRWTVFHKILYSCYHSDFVGQHQCVMNHNCGTIDPLRSVNLL